MPVDESNEEVTEYLRVKITSRHMHVFFKIGFLEISQYS